MQAFVIDDADESAHSRPANSAPAAVGGDGDGDGASEYAVATIADALNSLHSNAALIAAAEEHLQVLLSKQHILMQAERLLEQDKVASLLPDRTLGFHRGRPVAAILLSRCLQQWGALGVAAPGDDDAAALLRRFATLLSHQVWAEDGDDEDLQQQSRQRAPQVRATTAYWLAVSSVLLSLIVRAAWRAESAGAGGAVEGRSQSVRRGVAQFQRRLADRMGELHLGSRLGDGLHMLLRGKGAAAAAAAAAIAAANPNPGAAGVAGGGVVNAPPGSEEVEGLREPVPSLASVSSMASAGSAANAASMPQLQQQQRQQPQPRQQQDPTTPGGGASQALVLARPQGQPGTPTAGSLSPPLPRSVSIPEPLGEFVHALDTIVQGAFLDIRDQLRRRLLPLLANCMTLADVASSISVDFQEQQAAASSSSPPLAADGQRGPPHSGAPNTDSPFAAAAAGPAAGAADSGGGSGFRDALFVADAQKEAEMEVFRDWAEIVSVLSGAAHVLREQQVPRPLVTALFRQVLLFIDAQLFNQLLLRPEICSARNARLALRGLKLLDGLLLRLGADEADGGAFGRDAWQALGHTRQALQFLALERKQHLSLDDLSQDVCPSLTQQQLYRLFTTAWDDRPGAGLVSGEVLEAMQQRHTEASAVGAGVAAAFLHHDRGAQHGLTNQGLVVTCLLDEPGTPPFVAEGSGRATADAALSWTEGWDYTEGVPVPQQLLGEDCPPEVFAFLQEPTQW